MSFLASKPQKTPQKNLSFYKTLFKWTEKLTPLLRISTCKRDLLSMMSSSQLYKYPHFAFNNLPSSGIILNLIYPNLFLVLFNMCCRDDHKTENTMAGK
jgi:hypothetical protein